MEWLTLIGPALTAVESIINRMVPDPNQAAALNAQIKLALIQQDAAAEAQVNELIKAQIQVNLEEAKNQSTFVSGWRPMIGWVTAAGFVYTFVAQPTLTWIVMELGASKPLPSLDMATLWPLAAGMLGLAGLRSFEKVKGAVGVEPTAPKMFS